jgi:hypothetical protein
MLIPAASRLIHFSFIRQRYSTADLRIFCH